MDEMLEWVPGGATTVVMAGALAAAGAYYVRTRPQPETPIFPLDAQAFIEPVSIPFIKLYV